MRKALFIASSIDELNTRQESNRWHYVESNDDKVEYQFDNSITEKWIQPYLIGIKTDALIYLADKQSLAYLSGEEAGVRRKSGIIYVYTDSEFVSKNIIAKSIGCYLPNSLSQDLNPPYCISGKNIEKYLKQNPIDLGWFTSRDNYDDSHDLKTVVIPILDQILQLLLNKEELNRKKKLNRKKCLFVKGDKQKHKKYQLIKETKRKFKQRLQYKRCLLVSEKNDVSKLGKLLKRVLLTLPRAIANQFSFNTNACANEALKNIDIACIGNWGKFHLPDNYKDKFEIINIDNEIKDYTPVTITGKYILDKNDIPKALKESSANTASALEASIAEIKLNDICKNGINYSIIHDVLDLYKSISDKTKIIEIKDKLTSAAYSILLSKEYFLIDKTDRDELAEFLTVDKKLKKDLTQLLLEAINTVDDEKGSEYLLFLFKLLNNDCVAKNTCVIKKISNFLYLGEWINSKESTIKLFFDKLENFEQYLGSLPAKINDILKAIIIARLKEEYVDGRSKIELYLRIRTKNNIWLEEYIFNSDSLTSYEDLITWEESYKKIKSENTENVRNKELIFLKKQFNELFLSFIEDIDFFNKDASDLYKNVEIYKLGIIESVSTTFEFKNKALNDKLAEIKKHCDDEKEKDLVRNVLMYRRSQFLLKAHYPTATMQDGLFEKKRYSEKRIKEKLISLDKSQGKKTIHNTKIKGNFLQFFSGLSPYAFLSLLFFVVATLIFYVISGNDYGWMLFESLIGISAEKIRIIFYSLVISACFATHLAWIILANKNDIAEKTVAKKAFFISCIVFLLPCIGITFFMKCIG